MAECIGEASEFGGPRLARVGSEDVDEFREAMRLSSL